MKKKNISTVEDSVHSPDPSSILAYLEETLENETRRIRDERARLAKELEEKLKRNLDSFRKEEKQKAEKTLGLEKERLSRTFELEERRIISRLMEELFESIIKEAAEQAGKAEVTFQRVIAAVTEAGSGEGQVIVFIGPGDEPLRKKIQALKIKGVTVAEDPAIRNGGAVISFGGDSVLNLTTGRLLFRKKESLRLEMMTLLREEGLLTKLEELYGSW